MELKTVLSKETYGLFDNLIKMMQHSQPRTINTYIYILNKIDYKILKNLSQSKNEEEIKQNTNILLSYLRDESKEFHFLKNINLTSYAIKAYLKSELAYNPLTYFNNIIKPYLNKTENVSSRSQRMKYVPEEVIKSLINATKYNISTRKDIPQELQVYSKSYSKRLNIYPREEGYERDMLYYLIKTLSTSGLRISEALTLTFNNLLKEKIEGEVFYYLKVEHGKGGKTGKRLTTKKMYEELLVFRDKYNKKNEDLVFDVEIENINKDVVSINLSKRRVSTKQLYILHRKCKKIRDEFVKLGKISNFYSQDNALTPHMLRHGLGMLLYKKGMPLDKIQTVLDHNDISTTQIYAHATKKDVGRDFKKIME